MDTSVSGSPVTAALRDLFGDDWVNALCEVYTLGEAYDKLLKLVDAMLEEIGA